MSARSGEEALPGALDQASAEQAEPRPGSRGVPADPLTVVLRGEVAQKLRELARRHDLALMVLVQDALFIYEGEIASGYAPGTCVAISRGQPAAAMPPGAGDPRGERTMPTASEDDAGQVGAGPAGADPAERGQARGPDERECPPGEGHPPPGPSPRQLQYLRWLAERRGMTQVEATILLASVRTRAAASKLIASLRPYR